MKKNMLIRIVSLLCVVACLFAFASCHEDLATKEELNNATTTNKTDLTEAQKALYEAMDAVKATADAAATKAALEEVKAALETVKGTSDAAATQEALENALASLAEVKATADAAATQTALNELKASLEAAIAAVKTTADAAATQAALEAAIAAADKANTDLKTELDAKIEDNTTLIGTKVTELQAAIDAVKATADAAATKEALDAAVADITADLEAVKTTADAAATKTALDAVIADLAAVKTTADAAATQTALDAVIADLAAVKGTSDAAATKVALDAAIAEINTVKSTYATKAELEEVSTLLATVKNTADAAATKEALTAAQAALNAALTAANGNIAANAEAINGIKESIKTLATAENLAAVNAELANVKATADAAQTAEEVAAAIEAAIANLKLDDKIAAAKTELGNNITALETKLAADIKANADEIAALKTEIANLKLSVGDKTEVTNLATKVANLEKALAEIDTEAFKNAYVSMTDKLLDENYEYAYSKFVALILDIDDGPYDPDEAKAVRLQAEDILFEVTRAVSEDGLADLYNELVALKANLKTLEESLSEKVAAITYINTTAESIAAVKAADKIYERMVSLEIEIEDADLEAKYLRIWNAYIELNGGTTKDETQTFPGYKNVAAEKIDAVIATLLNRDVKLGTDLNTIEAYEAAIASLKNNIDNSQYRDLYEAGLVEDFKAAVKAEVIAAKTAEFIIAGEAANLVTYTKNYRDAFVASIVDGLIAEKYAELYNAKLAEYTSALVAGGATVEDAAAQAKVQLDGEEATLATLNNEAAIAGAAAAEAKANETDNANKFVADAKAQIAEEAATAANDYAESDNGKQFIFVKAMAESLFNEDAAEAVRERYDNMVKALNDATTLVSEVGTILNNWVSTGLLWTDDTASNALAAINAWVADTKYQSTNEAYIAAYAFCDDTITDYNRDYVFGKYNNTAVTNYKQLTDVVGYVAALKTIYDEYNFVTDSFNVNGVVALLAEVKKAVNDGVDNVLDIDSIAVDHSKAAIVELDAKVLAAAANNNVAAALNSNAMVGAIVRNRIDVIESAESALAGIITEIETDYLVNGEWSVTDINAADVIDAYRARVNAVYVTVQTDSNGEYAITARIISSLAEEALRGAYDAFEEYTKEAVQAFKDAEALIAEIEELGAVKLNYGKNIYKVLMDIEASKIHIKGLKNTTNFTFFDEALNKQRTVNFFELEERLEALQVAYAALAAEAEAKADALTTAITDLLAAVGNNANKLNNFNAIATLMRKVENEWLNYFYSDDMKATANNDKYVDAANRIAAIKAAVADTMNTNIIGGKGAVYAFLTSETFAKLETITKTAIDTYKAAEKWAAGWVDDAKTIVNNNNWTFHDWDKAGKNFKNIEEDYVANIAKYYTTFDANTVPGFELFAKHEAFKAQYDLCKVAAETAATEIKAIEDAIDALGAYNTVTLANTGERRTAVNAIYTAIANFETNFCSHATEEFDGHPADLNADKLFTLAKYNGILEIAEYYVTKATELAAVNYDAAYSLDRAVEAVDLAENAEQLADFVARYQSNADEAIEGGVNP